MPKKGTNGERPGRAAKKPPVCGKWISDNDPRGPTKERCRRPKGHSGPCQGLTVNVPPPPPKRKPRISCLCTDKAVHPACPLHRPPPRTVADVNRDQGREMEDALGPIPEPKPSRREVQPIATSGPLPAAPSQGSFKWLNSCPVMGCYRLRIRSGETVNDYDVEPDAEGWRLHYLAVVWTADLEGRRIRSIRLKDYLVRTKSPAWTCSCDDFKHRVRDGGCKHVKALRKALAALPF
jgi:hypothetical protein